MKITVEIAPTEIVEINRKLNKFDGKNMQILYQLYQIV